ncbi:MAG: tRNA (adenosine(37)-N6)-threonylcarbamoyltransferase complex ATPase subunit type 1 TsaE [Longimicrobiales bacterium]
MILSEGELVRWGNRIGRDISGPVFLGLKGPLGAGKSVLARAVARGAGVEGPIPSPTFNLVFHYPTPRGIPLVHMDLYRIEDPVELWELGWEELGAEGELVVVEWPERARELLPQDRWEIDLVIPEMGSERRLVAVSRFGDPPHLPGFPFRLQGPEAAE